MVSNKHDKYYREYIKLTNEYNEILDKRRNIPLIKYDKPRPNGWWVSYDLRKDILSRQDSHFILEAVNVGYKPRYISNVKHVRMMRAGHRGYWTHIGGRRNWVQFSPDYAQLKENEYQNLHPAVQKYFVKSDSTVNSYPFKYVKDRYHIQLPQYWLVLRAKTRYLTHYQEIDPVLESRKEIIRQKLESYWRKFGGNYRRNLPYPYQRERSRIRADIQRFKAGEIDDIAPTKFHELD